MKVTTQLLQNVAFKATTGSGHEIIMDGPPDHGGENLGARPMEMMLVSMGGCASFDVVHILRKKRKQVASCEAQIEAERADEEPKVFTKIHIHFIVSGEGLSEKAVAQAVQLSADKYCSASIMLAKTADVTHSFELLS